MAKLIWATQITATIVNHMHFISLLASFLYRLKRELVWLARCSHLTNLLLFLLPGSRSCFTLCSRQLLMSLLKSLFLRLPLLQELCGVFFSRLSISISTFSDLEMFSAINLRLFWNFGSKLGFKLSLALQIDDLGYCSFFRLIFFDLSLIYYLNWASYMLVCLLFFFCFFLYKLIVQLTLTRLEDNLTLSRILSFWGLLCNALIIVIARLCIFSFFGLIVAIIRVNILNRHIAAHTCIQGSIVIFGSKIWTW